MKWFIKCLKHYADFSGRARRKEFWMFVLFNIIFSFVWQFLAVLVFAFVNNKSGYSGDELSIAAMVASLSYAIAMLLPGWAVAVRRLHDAGKSGWMLLISLIPIIGGIWLLVLMLTDGQQGENKYGPDPKISPEVFGEAAKLRSVGIVLLIASVILILNSIILILRGFPIFRSNWWLLLIYSTLLIAGVFLLNAKKLYETQGKGRVAVILLLIVFSILSIVYALFGVISRMNFDSFAYFIVVYFIRSLHYLLVALFIASILFLSQKERLIRSVGVLAILFSVLFLLLDIYSNMRNLSYLFDGFYSFGTFFLFNAFVNVAFIVLIGTFLSIKNQSVLGSSSVLENGNPSATDNREQSLL